jgi:hypothetical protein
MYRAARSVVRTQAHTAQNSYHSADGAFGASMQVDLGATYNIMRVDFHNRQSCCTERIIGARVELYSETNVLLARSYINTAAAFTSLKFAMASPPICETSFQGGGWLLVRHLNQGATEWFQATDDLYGLDVYGDYSLGINAASAFSISYRALVNASTEFLFSTGVLVFRFFNLYFSSAIILSSMLLSLTQPSISEQHAFTDMLILVSQATQPVLAG